MNKENNITTYMQSVGQQARAASCAIAKASTATKNAALRAIADAIMAAQDQLMAENKKDIEAGKRNGLDAAMLDRLTLDAKRIVAMAEGVRQIAQLADPVGAVSETRKLTSGIQLSRMRVPIGVIGIIYESRPNVTVDAAALCLKAGNAAILRGGSEALYSNQAIAACVHQGLKQAELPIEIVQVINTTDRQAVSELLKLDAYVDVIIPRGGKGLIQRVADESKIPVIKHLDGVCHVYIDDRADLQMAERIAINAKTHRYGVCNAMETLLIAKDVAEKILPTLVEQYSEKGVELRGCERSRAIVKMNTATEADWSTEYLAPILAIRLVNDINDAIAHITQYGSAHTDTIVTADSERAQQFLREVDSSSVMVNASTRFADGFEYGLGAEIGISTNKLHVRGPVGLEGLTTQKYIAVGEGQIRE